MNENNKITKIALISFISSTPFFLSIFVVFIATFFVLGLFDGDGSSGGSISQGGGYTYTIDGVNVSDIKVRLLKCEGYEPIPGEELVDFETYILGVVYQENGGGPYEALKAQAVAARSYSLTRPNEMGGDFGISLENEDGQWILQIRNCVSDQVFCNPDKGCWSKVPGGQTGDGVKVEDCTVYTGVRPDESYWPGEKLAKDSMIRKAVEETQGEVLVDNNGEIIYTEYNSTKQNKWNSLANDGKDYFEILVEEYGSDIRLETPTYNPPDIEGDGVATGNYTNPCPSYVRLSSPFGWRIHPVYHTRKFHNGIDLAASKGKPVYAFDGGKILKIRTDCEVGVTKCGGGAGNNVQIDHGNGMITLYYHLSKVLVEEDQKITIGQQIGEVGNTGASTGPHLHFGIKVDGKYVNPENYYTFDKK